MLFQSFLKPIQSNYYNELLNGLEYIYRLFENICSWFIWNCAYVKTYWVYQLDQLIACKKDDTLLNFVKIQTHLSYWEHLHK